VLASLKPGMLLDAKPLGLANYATVLGDRNFWSVIGNTLLLGGGSVAVMLVFVVPFAWLYTRTDLPGKDWLLTLLTVKIAVPGFLVAMAYVVLFNPSNGVANTIAGDVFGAPSPPFNVYSLAWITFLQGAALVTSAFFMLVPTFRAIDVALEEAAFVSGIGKWLVTTRVVLALAGPAILATSIYYFIVAIEAFDYAGMIGLPVRILVFSTWLYRLSRPADSGDPAYGEAAALGMLATLFVGLLTLLYLWSIRRAERYAVVTGKRGQQVSTRLSKRAKMIAWAFIGVYLAIELVIPVLMLVWTSLLPYVQPPSPEALRLVSLQAYHTALQEVPPLLANTLLLMVAVPTVVVVVATCLAWLVTRTRFALRRPLELMLMATVAVPTIVGALAFLYLGISIYKILPIYTTIWIIVLALATRFLTWANRTVSSAMLQVHQELEEACAISGVSRGRAFLSVLVPTVLPALLFSWFWVALLALRELTVPLMLARSDTQVLATAIWGFNASGYPALASAMGVLLLILIGVMVAVFQRVAGKVSI
jgi:iron(III) transport system permease protein